MKKLLGSTLALAMLVPAGANAELLKNLKMGGSLEVDAVSANNVTDFNTAKYDDIGTVQTRLMVHADWDLLDDVHAHVSVDKNDRTYGGTAGGNGGASQNVNQVTTLLWVDESYVKVDKLFGALDTTLGRQFYGEAGDVVIYYGPKYNLYGMPITALDGVRFDWNGEKHGVTLLAAKTVGGALGAIDTANVSVFGVDLHCHAMDNLTGSVYLYDRTTVNSGTAGSGVVGNDYLYVAGLKAKFTQGGAWAKAEFDKDFGSNRTGVAGDGTYGFAGSYTGWAGKLNAGYKADVSGVGALTGWGEYALGSGGSTPNRNFTAIAGDYRPGGIYGRFLATGAGGAKTYGQGGTLSDLQVVGLGVKATPSALNKLTAGLSWYNYRFQNIQAAQAFLGTGPNFGSNQLGNEADLDLTWQHSENVSVSVGAGDFQPNGMVKAVAAAAGKPNNPATLLYADATLKF